MNSEQEIADAINNLAILQSSFGVVHSDLKLAISSIPFLQIQKKILSFSESIYNSIVDLNLKKELISYSNKCQVALLCGDSNEFAKNIFLQIESIVNFGLFSRVTLSQINTDLQDPTNSITLAWQKPNTKTLAEFVFGWNQQNITSIKNGKNLDEKDISFKERVNLYNYYFFYLKSSSRFPDFDLTNTVKLIRDKTSHGQAKVTDNKNLIPTFEKEFISNHYQLCHKYFQLHIMRFVNAL